MKPLVAFLIALAIVTFFTSCAKKREPTAKGVIQGAHITCFSGGHAFYSANATGEIGSNQHNGIWYFQESVTNKFMHVSGACIVED